MTERTDDFEVAKSVFEILKDLSRERQERVVRWVSEGLGVSQPTSLPLPSSLPIASGPSSKQTPKDIKSFVEEKKPKSDQQFVTTVAYYYRFEAPPAERKETIDAQTAQEATRLVGRNRLNNATATLHNAKNAGYLDSLGGGEFSINSVGENLVAMALAGDEGATGLPRKRKRKKASRKGPGRKRPRKKVARRR